MKIRHEGCQLFGSLTNKLQWQSSLSMVSREALRIPLSLFRLRTSPRNLKQNFKSANISNKMIEYQNSYLSRRHVIAWKFSQGGSDRNGHSGFLVATSRICNQPQKVHSDSPTKNCTFRSASGFSQHVIVFDSRETDESDQPMFGDVQDRESVYFIIDKGHRFFSVFTTSSGRIAQSRPFISTSNNLKFQCKTLFWWVQNLKLCNGRYLVQFQAQMVIQSDAFKTGWGASCEGLTTRGVWPKQERTLHINVLEDLAVKLALLSFTKNR